MPMSERRQSEHLDRFWGDLARGEAPGDRGFDPAVANTVRRLHALHQPPQIDPAFMDRLEAELLDPASTATALAPIRLATSPNGRGSPTAWPRFVLRSEHSHRALLAAQLATAALVLVTLVSSFLILRQPRPSSAPDQPVVVPAVDTVDVAPGEPIAETLLAIEIPRESVADRFDTALSRLRMAPGREATVEGDRWDGFPGTWMTHVLSGQLTFRGESSARVLRSGAPKPEDVAAGTVIVLNPGDAAVYPFDQPRSYANSGSEPVDFLEGGVVTAGWYPPGWPNGIQDLKDAGSVQDSSVLPEGPLVLRLQKIAVPAGAAFPPPSGRTPDGVRASLLELREPLPPGASSPAENQIVYDLTLSGTVLSPLAVEVTDESLLDTVVDGLPDVHAVLALENWSLRPSETPLTLRPLGGPRVAVVSDGLVTATVAGAARDLGPGEHLVVPGDRDVSLVNAGLGEASLAVVYLVPSYVQGGETRNSSNPVAQSRELVDIFVAPTLISASPDALPGGRARLVVQRLSVPRDGRLPEASAQPQTWMAITKGTLGVTLDGQRLPFGWEPGEERTIAAGQYLPEIAPGTRMILRNAGQDSLVLYRLSVSPDPASSAGSAHAMLPGASLTRPGSVRRAVPRAPDARANSNRGSAPVNADGLAVARLDSRSDLPNPATQARASPG